MIQVMEAAHARAAERNMRITKWRMSDTGREWLIAEIRDAEDRFRSEFRWPPPDMHIRVMFKGIPVTVDDTLDDNEVQWDEEPKTSTLDEFKAFVDATGPAWTTTDNLVMPHYATGTIPVSTYSNQPA